MGQREKTDLKDWRPPPERGGGARVEDVVDHLHAGKVGGRRQRVVGAAAVPGGGRRGHDAGQRTGRGDHGGRAAGWEAEERVRGSGLAPSGGGF